MKGEKWREKIFANLFEVQWKNSRFSGLKNDSTPEVFELKHKTFENEDFPVLYLQVIPLLSYGPSFNFSIWFIELLGLEDDLIVCNTLRGYNEKKEKTTIRLILKHLRQKGHFEAFEALSRETNIQLEDQEITNLYQRLVDTGDFVAVEKIMEKLINGEKGFKILDNCHENCLPFTEGHVSDFIAKQKYKAKFTEMQSSLERPKPRTQAAYAFDESRQLVYMFGGYDETNELNDFWVFNLNNNEWSPVENNNGPSPRSGAKMVFDSVGNQLFIIGRKTTRGSETLKVIIYLRGKSFRGF